MTKLAIQLNISYSQICIFRTSLQEPFNDWSDRNCEQGFSWRPGSASFRSLIEAGDHQVNIFINESVPELSENCVRAIRVPFNANDVNIEIASISDSKVLQMVPGDYALQVEFLELIQDTIPEINIRLNKGKSDFVILKADAEIVLTSDFELHSQPAN
jgi:hypothetical protein